MQKVKPRLAVTIGDPAGIGPEIVLKAFFEPRVHTWADLVVVGSQQLLEVQAEHLGLSVRFHGPKMSSALGAVPVYNVPLPKEGSWQFGEVSAACGHATVQYLETAVQLAKDGKVQGIVTAPIHKEAWKAAHIPFPGHTEALGAAFGAHVETMFVVDKLRVFFLTRHVSLQRAIELITKERLIELLCNVKQALEGFGLKDPTVAVAALNPHAGEGGLFGDEEIRELKPGIELAQAKGIQAVGPIPADVVFHQALQGRYEAVVALYHDQGHIATKTYDFFHTVSVTTGLPIIRSSVDHGTAFDIADKGIADATSMIEAVRVAAELTQSGPRHSTR